MLTKEDEGIIARGILKAVGVLALISLVLSLILVVVRASFS